MEESYKRQKRWLEIENFSDLARVLSGEFPALLSTISRLRRLSRHRAALRRLRLALPCPRSRSLPLRLTAPTGLGSFYRGARTAFRRKERMSPPRFLGDPCVHAVLFDPGGAPAPGRSGASAAFFRPVNDVDSALSAFEAQSHSLHAPCVRFAGGIPPKPRNTRFRWMASPYRFGTCTRPVTVRGFRLLKSLRLSCCSSRLCLAQ
jgi:hypothetical protein